MFVFPAVGYFSPSVDWNGSKEEKMREINNITRIETGTQREGGEQRQRYRDRQTETEIERERGRETDRDRQKKRQTVGQRGRERDHDDCIVHRKPLYTLCS